MKEIVIYTSLVILFLLGVGLIVISGFVRDYYIAVGPSWVSIGTWSVMSSGIALIGAGLISASIALILTRMGA